MFLYRSRKFNQSNAVSMVEADLFDKLAKIGGILRKNSLPFGGIQVGHLTVENDSD